MKNSHTFLFLFSFLFFGVLSAQDTEVANTMKIDADRLSKDVHFLASEECEGRATGQPGEKLAAQYIQERFQTLGLKPKGDDGSYFDTFSFSYNPMRIQSAHGMAPDESVKLIEGTGINVAAYLDNSAEHTIIIGAHYDHLGRGEFGNSRDPNGQGAIHYGADDNASGAAGVMALAEYFCSNKRREKTNFLFICFSGEELGLIGSKKYVEDKLFPFEKVNYMINLDMIGRLDSENPKLFIHGIGTAAVWDSLTTAHNPGYQLVKDSSGVGPSDFTSFYLSQMPVIHFYTGAHSDYHTPWDTPDKINYDGQTEVLHYIIDIIQATEEMPRLVFQETVNKQAGPSRFKVTLGVMPDYSFAGPGLKIDGVSEDRPAQKAGIQAGDIILSIGEQEINDIQDYMKILGSHEKGDQVPAIVKRKDKTVKLKVVF